MAKGTVKKIIDAVTGNGSEAGTESHNHDLIDKIIAAGFPNLRFVRAMVGEGWATDLTASNDGHPAREWNVEKLNAATPDELRAILNHPAR